MIEISGLEKRFKLSKKLRKTSGPQYRRGFYYALDGVQMAVAAGEVHGLVGENGSGKSTLMRIIAGLVSPNSGSVRINGFNVSRAQRKDAIIGYLPASGKLYAHLSVRENVEFFAKLAGAKNEDVECRTNEVLLQLNCDSFADRRPSELSFGMYQKARLARVLAMHPDVLLLDEPSTGVDIVGISELTQLISQLSETGIPILLATHNVNEIEDFCDRITVLKHGKSIFTGSLPELYEMTGKHVTHDALYTVIQEGVS
jgi:sodium transport system ATP-binding protein